MSAKVQMDSTEFNRMLSKFAALQRHGFSEVLRRQGALAVKDAVQLTPPHNGKPRLQSLAGQLKTGERVVKREIKKAFIPVAKLKAAKGNSKLARRLKRLAANGSFNAVEKILGNVMPGARVARVATFGQHKRSRDRRGRVMGRQATIVMSEGSMARVLAGRLANVGIAKSGWAKAASALGVKLPAWITRHSSPGHFKDDTMNKERPTIEIGNSVGFIQERGRELAIVRNVLAARWWAMKKQVDAANRGAWNRAR